MRMNNQKPQILKESKIEEVIDNPENNKNDNSNNLEKDQMLSNKKIDNLIFRRF